MISEAEAGAATAGAGSFRYVYDEICTCYISAIINRGIVQHVIAHAVNDHRSCGCFYDHVVIVASFGPTEIFFKTIASTSTDLYAWIAIAAGSQLAKTFYGSIG